MPPFAAHEFVQNETTVQRRNKTAIDDFDYCDTDKETSEIIISSVRNTKK